MVDDLVSVVVDVDEVVAGGQDAESGCKSTNGLAHHFDVGLLRPGDADPQATCINVNGCATRSWNELSKQLESDAGTSNEDGERDGLSYTTTMNAMSFDLKSNSGSLC